MSDTNISQLVDDILKKMGSGSAAPNTASSSTVAEGAPKPAGACNLTEFVGTAIGHTVGLVIANVDRQVHEKFGLDPKYRSIGIVGDRTGAGPQIFAADEAVKATNVEVLKIELPRDTEGGAGHGSLIVFGAEDVSDARRAVEVTLAGVERTMGDVYGNSAGHLEFQYTARASHALAKAFGAPEGKAFGITVGAPAAIGVLLGDTAVKAATVDVVSVSSPAHGTSFSNEVITTFSGDSGAVKQAIVAAREVGRQVLGAMEPSEPLESTTTPYII